MANLYFKPVIIMGETVDFSHLQPFKFEFFSNNANKILRVHVTYSNHCFTQGYEESKYTEGEPIFDERTSRPRIFCPIRYKLSKELPRIICELNDSKIKVFETTSERNWTFSKKIDDPKGPYHVFFEIKRASKEQTNFQELNLTVESAYHEDPEKGPPNVKGSMKFHLLCSNIYMKKPTSTRR